MGNAHLHNEYRNNANFALQARMIPALTFVRQQDVGEAFAALQAYLPVELNPILDWFEDSYIGRPFGRNGNRRRPLFPVETWNCHERVLNGVDRTNNYAEAAHKRLKEEFGVHHPSIWTFIDKLKRSQVGRDAFFESLLAGGQPPKKRAKYVRCDRAIERLVRDYNNRTKIQFLRGIAHNFRMEA